LDKPLLGLAAVLYQSMRVGTKSFILSEMLRALPTFRKCRTISSWEMISGGDVKKNWKNT